MDVHPTAIIADGASLGEGVRIGPYCIVGPRVRIGSGCHLHAAAVIEGDTEIGAECEIFPHAVIGAQPRDENLTADEPGGKLRIGKRNRFRECVTIDCGTLAGGGETRIGDDNLFLAGSKVGHDCEIGSFVVFTNLALAAGHTTFGDRSVVGGNVGIYQYCRIGTLAMLGGGSVVPKDVTPYALVQGDRARLRGINLVGLQQAGFSGEDVHMIKLSYRELFRRGGPLSERLAKVREIAGGNPRVEVIADFIADTRRGIVMPRAMPG